MQIGWSCRDVTPRRPVALCGQFYVRISEGVNDPLTATALALESASAGGRSDQGIMISLDLVGLPGHWHERLRELVKPRLPGFDVNKIIVNCTHTHTAPVVTEGAYPEQGPEVMTPTAYGEFLIAQAADAAVEAWEGRKPASVAWAFGQAVVGHNRRACYSDGSARMYGKTDDPRFECIEGYEDHSVNMLFVFDGRRELTGVVVNLSCPSQVTENARYLSADFWHEARAEIRKRCGKGLFILPQCAPAGDQSPHFLIYKKEEARMRERLGLTEREVIGQEIASAVADALPGARDDMQADPAFRHAVRTVHLPMRMVTDHELEAARAECRRLEALRTEPGQDASDQYVLLRRCRDVIERHGRQKTQTHYPMELHALRVGEVAFATDPFELFLDFGIRIKARSRALQTFLVQLACDYKGYLPTARAASGSGYGAQVASNFVGPEGGQVLVEETVREIAALWPEES